MEEARINRCSSPSELRITDMRFVDLVGAPMHCTLVKIYTNQGITGVGEIRDFGSRIYGQTLKGRLLGENPCNVERLFRRIRQHAGPARQAGGVSGIEIALWDLAGKAYGVPVYQLLGGKYRDAIRMYCDAGVNNSGRMDGAASARSSAGMPKGRLYHGEGRPERGKRAGTASRRKR